MIGLFTNYAKRSANQLLADHAACRQLRHISKELFGLIIQRTAEGVEKVRADRPDVKHPDPKNPCDNCGRSRSKYSGNSGLCFRCFASKADANREYWVEDVFVTAIQQRGFSCDGCTEAYKPNYTDARRAASHMLDNMDGAVKPVLCPGCESAFKTFCSTHYGPRAWSTEDHRDLEKMAIGWLALKVKILAERVRAA